MYTLSFIAMFLSTYAMIDATNHFYLNINRIYMALLMTGLMGIINGFVMWNMYESPKIKFGLIIISIITVVLSFTFMRYQYPIGNQSFLRAMIPHHSSAILMCQEADITDPEIKQLCVEIIDTQKREIKLMKELLNE